MKIDVYGKPYDQRCQDAVGLLKAAKIKVKFNNTDYEPNKKELIKVTERLQKEAGFKFESLENCSVPIVISEDTQEVLVGYEYNTKLYNNILKEAGVEEVEKFVRKYPEWRRKK
jgi:hypothetical protein